MDPSTVDKISKQVLRQFPEMAGAKPSIRLQKTPGGGAQFVLTYKARAALPNGKAIQRVVRVIAAESGRIVKISTSK